MKTLKKLSIVLFVFHILCSISIAAEFRSEQPILITSAGQSADVLMVKILAKKANLQFAFDKLASPDSLKNYKSLIMVSGGSTKGLGAAKIDKQDELDRINKLIKSANTNKINIITMHLGGKARRGKLSDEFNKLAAENANCLIIVKSGDDDHFFSNIAKEKKIPIQLIEKIMEAGDVMKGIFATAEK
jgi:hypothetical protein